MKALVKTKVSSARAGLVGIIALAIIFAACGDGNSPGPVPTGYVINIGTFANGAVTSNKATAEEGDDVTLTIAPDGGYVLRRISVTDSDDENVSLNGQGNMRTFTMPPSAVTVDAEFIVQKTQHAITVTPNPLGQINVSEAQAQEGVEVTIRLIPNEPEFVEYQDGTLSVKGTEDPYTPVAVTKSGDMYIFEMVDFPVTISAQFRDTRIPSYQIEYVHESAGQISGATVAPIDTQVTVTLQTVNDEYRYVENSIEAFYTPEGGAKVSLTLTPAGQALTWTFNVPEEKHADKITVTAQWEEIPSHQITILYNTQAQLGTNSFTISPLATGTSDRAREGKTVTLTLNLDTEDYTFTSVSAKTTSISEPITLTQVGSTSVWTFTMPTEAVTIDAVFEFIPYYDITLTLVSNGTFAVTAGGGTGEYADKARAGKTVTLTATPATGYVAQTPQVTGTGTGETITVTPGVKNVYTFVMPAEAVTVTGDFLPTGATLIYSDGTLNNIGGGISITPLNHPTYQFGNTYQTNVDLNAVVSGTKLTINEVAHNNAIRVVNDNSTGEIGFSLKTATPYDIGGTGGLSFYIRRVNTGASQFSHAGFGENNSNAVYYAGDSNDGRLWIEASWADSDWKQVIIPAPKIKDVFLVNHVFSFKTNLAANEAIYIDEIKFLPGNEVVLSEIELPATALLPVGGTENAAAFINSLAGFKLKYAAPSNSNAIITPIFSKNIDSNLADGYRWSDWFTANDFTFASSNTAVATVTGGNIVTVGNGTTNITAQYNGKTSTSMSLTVDSMVQLAIFRPGTTYNASGFFTWDWSLAPGVNGDGEKLANTIGGQIMAQVRDGNGPNPAVITVTFAAVDISGCADLKFRIKPNAAVDPGTIVLELQSGGNWYAAPGFTVGDNNSLVNPGDTTRTIAINAFTGLTPATVTGLRFTLTKAHEGQNFGITFADFIAE